MNYFLHGNDSILLKEKMTEILKDLSLDSMDDVTVLDGQNKEIGVQSVLDSLSMVSLFSMDSNVVVWQNPLLLTKKSRKKKNPQNDDEVTEAETNPDEILSEKDKAEMELLKKYLEHPYTNGSSLIIYLDESVYSVGNDGYSKYIKDNKTVVRDLKVGFANRAEFEDRVRREIRQRNLNIDNSGLRELFFRLPMDLSAWRSEAEKLALYPERITADAVRHLVTRPLEDKAYELTNAVMSKNLKKALDVLNDLLYQKTDLNLLMGMIGNNFRNFYTAYYLQKEMSNDEIAKALGMRSGGQVYHLLNDPVRFSPKSALAMLDKLADMDDRIKHYTIDPKLGMELFLIEACK